MPRERKAFIGDGHQLLVANIAHKRIAPGRSFTYRMLYLALELSALESLKSKGLLGVNKPGLLRFDNRDHGAKDGSALFSWGRQILARHGIEDIAAIQLIAMPRVLGYVFNPVTFWLCRQEQGKLRAVICQVHNTFGENHLYICSHPSRNEILPGDELVATKLFHVSPFLPRSGGYRFRFRIQHARIGVTINYTHADGRIALATSFNAHAYPLSNKKLFSLWLRYPWMGIKAAMLIHLHACILWCRGVKYAKKPPQLAEKSSLTSVTKD